MKNSILIKINSLIKLNVKYNIFIVKGHEGGAAATLDRNIKNVYFHCCKLKVGLKPWLPF